MEVYETILLAVCYVSLCLLVILLCFAAVSYLIGVVVMAIKHFREKARGVRGAAAMQGWIPVAKQSPTEPGEYIVKIASAFAATTLWYNPVEDVWFNDDYRYGYRYQVTHWMPMPELPEED